MKPRVLVFIDWFSPGFRAGGPTTSNVNIVDHLHAQFDFWVITSNKDYHSPAPYTGIEFDKWVDRGNCKVFYFSQSALSFRRMMEIARQSEASVWYINGIYSRYFSLYPLIISKLLKIRKVIVSSRGMLSPHALKVKPTLKMIYLNVLKSWGLYKNVIFHGTNKQECDDIKKVISDKSRCVSIANLPRKGKFSYVSSGKKEGEIKLVSFARISPEKNTLYAINALRSCKGRIFYDIYGQINSQSYWEECKQAIKSLPKNITVTYKGVTNPDQLATLYREYDALYLPTTGENFGHAILESFMNSRPVIISDQTPWKNLEKLSIGFDIALSYPDKFASAVDIMAEMNNLKFETYCMNAHSFSQQLLHKDNRLNSYINLFDAKI